MLIPRKEKGQLEIYKCKLGIHDWITEHWWELRQRPRNTLTRKGGRKRAQYYKKYRTRTYCRICGKPRSILKKRFGISDSAITRIINLKSKPKFGNYKFKAIYQDIMNDYQEGMLVRDICNKYSIGHTTLNNYLRRLNIVRHR